MAQQSNLRDVRARWLALAQDCLSLAKEAHDGKRAEGRSRSILTRLGSRPATGLARVPDGDDPLSLGNGLAFGPARLASAARAAARSRSCVRRFGPMAACFPRASPRNIFCLPAVID
jgi:hypothetical protein